MKSVETIEPNLGNFSMQPVKPANNKGIRLWVLLPLVVVLTVLLILCSGWIIEVVTGANPPKEVVDTSYPRLAEDLSGRVSGAFSPATEITPDSLLASNFQERQESSNSNKSDLATEKNNVIISPSQKEVTLSKVNPFSTNNPVKLTVSPTPVVNQNNEQNITVNQTDTVVDRFNERNNQLRRGGNVSPVSEIYDIEDVTPIGVVGDTRSREVMFYSPATKQTFSVPLGTRFRNGVLEAPTGVGNTVDGVQFMNNTGTTVTRNWGNSSGGSKETVEQPVLQNNPVVKPTATPAKTQKAKN